MLPEKKMYIVVKEDLFSYEFKSEFIERPLKLAELHDASMIIEVNALTGKSRIVKNRWGDHETLDHDFLRKPMRNPCGEVALHDISYTAKMPDLKTLLTEDQVKESFGRPSSFTILKKRNETCKCPMRDLMSTGHHVGCPEKKS